jgi:RecB family exonuclease
MSAPAAVPNPGTLVPTSGTSPAAPENCIPEVLSPSAVNCFAQCEARWYYRKVLQLPETRTAALGLGSAVHRTLAENFRNKLEGFDDIPWAGLRPVFLEALAEEFETVTFADDDDTEDLRQSGETMVRVYLEQAAPLIEPAAVELPVEGAIGSVPVRGVIDLLTADGTIIDLKTSARKPSGISGDHRLQLTTYAMLTPGASGVGRIDTLTKTKTVALHSQTTEVSMADRKHAERLYSITLDQMRTGLIKPNRGSWCCSKRFCSFWETCQDEYGGTVAE